MQFYIYILSYKNPYKNGNHHNIPFSSLLLLNLVNPPFAYFPLSKLSIFARYLSLQFAYLHILPTIGAMPHLPVRLVEVCRKLVLATLDNKDDVSTLEGFFEFGATVGHSNFPPNASIIALR